MKHRSHGRLYSLALAIATPAFVAHAQVAPPPDPDPADLANLPETTAPQQDWQIRVGGGTFYGPAFLGSKDYQLLAGPNIQVRFKDRVFLSVADGLGVDLIKGNGWRAGPVIGFQNERQEDNDSTFRIAGERSNALRGLGDVKATVEAGGYVEYQWNGFSAKVDVRQGIGGHDGLIANLGMRYTGMVAQLSASQRRPLIVSVGPRAVVVDSTYNNAYFGVNALQSSRSGLPQYRAEGGLLSYGMGGSATLPISRSLAATLLAGYDRLTGDAGKSPLVQERGSRNQAMVGFALTYQFGL